MKTIPLTENEINHIKETYSQELERLQKRAGEIASILKKLGGISSIEVADPLPTESAPVKNAEVPAIPTKRKYTRKSTIVAAPVESNEQVIENNIVEMPKKRRGRPAKIKTEETEILEEVVVKAEKKKPGRKKAEKTTKGTRGRKKSDDSKRSRWTNAILAILEEQEKLLSSRDIIEEIMKKQNIIASDYNKTRAIVAGSLSDLKHETKRLKTIKNPKIKGSLYGLTEWFDEAGALVDETKLPNE
ncbi:MAG: hypothetical protein Q8928_04505 [Bacteroidota bacterium]|nr:hypothetical protein [Bacteroidota bacterium]